MKIICLNYDNCDYYEYLSSPSTYEYVNSCPECNCLAVVVPDNFDITFLDESQPITVMDLTNESKNKFSNK
jgi:hypothetical protein